MAVVAVTGSSETAKKIQEGRGLDRLRFEGGGCNWSYVDDGYSPEDLKKIAVRLTYSKLGFGSHKCTSLHGIAASGKTLDALLGLIDEEMDGWKVADPREATDDKVVSPLMVHKAQTAAGHRRRGEEDAGRHRHPRGRPRGRRLRRELRGGEAGASSRSSPDSTVTVNWDGKGVQEVRLATTEFFMPILVGDGAARASTTSCGSASSRTRTISRPAIWTRDDRKLQRARRTLGGMLKENDGTDSALEWEEFGASGIGDSGNMGVGEVTATLSHLHAAAEGPAPGLLSASVRRRGPAPTPVDRSLRRACRSTVPGSCSGAPASTRDTGSC